MEEKTMIKILFVSDTHEHSKSKFYECVRHFSEKDSVRIQVQEQIVELDNYRYEFISLANGIQSKVLGNYYDKVIISEFATEEQVALLKTRERQ
jgi:hypothetical protein